MVIEVRLLIGCAFRFPGGDVYLMRTVQGKCGTVLDVVPTPRHKASSIKYLQIVGILRSWKGAELCVKAGQVPTLS